MHKCVCMCVHGWELVCMGGCVHGWVCKGE